MPSPPPTGNSAANPYAALQGVAADAALLRTVAALAIVDDLGVDVLEGFVDGQAGAVGGADELAAPSRRQPQP